MLCKEALLIMNHPGDVPKGRECNEESDTLERSPSQNGDCDTDEKVVSTEKKIVGRKNNFKSEATKARRSFPVHPRMVRLIFKPKSFVNHSYSDFSCIPPDSTNLDSKDTAELSFQEGLHRMVSDESLQEGITWMPHGRAFKILSPKYLERDALSKYFRHSCYSKLLTDIKRHGFKALTRGIDSGCFYHECFLKGLPHPCKYMPEKKSMSRKLLPDPDNEPDFYAINNDFPLPKNERCPEDKSRSFHDNSRQALPGQIGLAGSTFHLLGKECNEFSCGTEPSLADSNEVLVGSMLHSSNPHHYANEAMHLHRPTFRSLEHLQGLRPSSWTWPSPMAILNYGNSQHTTGSLPLNNGIPSILRSAIGTDASRGSVGPHYLEQAVGQTLSHSLVTMSDQELYYLWLARQIDSPLP